jgi:uncharacterized membrane protein YphA (DoxX/SURF4 family)
MKSYVLCITAGAMLIPFCIYLNNVVRDFVMDDLYFVMDDLHFVMDDSINDLGTPPLENGLAAILLLAIYAAQWFWSDPVQHGLSHCVDGIIAKITIITFFFYTMYYKNRWNDWLCISAVILILFFAFMSHNASSKEWCSDSHLFWHAGLHLVGSLSASYAFLDR